MSSNDSNQGLRTLFYPDPGERPEMDIVFVHGLGGHRIDTWSKGSCCWIETLVPKDLPRARVMTFGYDSSVAHPRGPISQISIFGSAEKLLDALRNERRVNDASKRPIIFVGHSLGGLVIKQALIRSKEYFKNGQDAKLGAIGQQALGAVFLASPHRGSYAARLADVICKAAKATWVGPNPHILDTLKSDSYVLESQHNSFVSISQSMLLVSIYEELETRGQMIVPRESAVMHVPNERSNCVYANHIEVCKFDSQKDDGYKKVIGYIRSMIDDARSSPEALDPDDQCLQSLSFDGMKRRSDFTQKTAGTCDWVLHHKEYVGWVYHGGLLWIQGSPGTGKSTIMASLLDRVAADSYNASFFFNRQGTGLQSSPIGFFRAILHQILSQDAEILSEFRQEIHCDERREKENNDRDGSQWTASELQDCLTRCIKRFTKRRQLCLYIDGLDEDGLAAAHDLATYLERLRVEVPTGLRICLSSRLWPSINWKSDYCIRVEDNNLQDIELFIRDSFKHSLRLSDPDTLHDILKEISRRAEGRFQWTVLVVKRVLRLQNESKDDILMEINSTPYEHTATDNRMMHAAQAQSPVEQSWLLPRQANLRYTGYTQTLERVASCLLCQSPKQVVCVLAGMGGVGKSETVLQVVDRNYHTLREKFWALFWVDCGSDASMDADFVRIGTTCGWPSDRAQVLEQLAVSNRNSLLVLDNCDDVQKDYRKCIPSNSRVSVIMTTRNADSIKYASPDPLDENLTLFLKLDGLREAECAVDLLLSLSQKHLRQGSYDQETISRAGQIVSALEYHPLAINVAASLLQSAVYSIDVYANACEHPLLENPPFARELLNTYSEGTWYHTISSTFEASARLLQRLSTTDPSAKAALALLDILGFMHYEDVSEEIFLRAFKYQDIVLDTQAANDDSENEDIDHLSAWHVTHLRAAFPTLSSGDNLRVFRKARSHLRRLSLINLDRSGKYMSMHRMVHAWTRDRNPEPNETCIAAASILALSAQPKPDQKSFEPQFVAHCQANFAIQQALDESVADKSQVLQVCRVWYVYACCMRHQASSEALGVCSRLMEQIARLFHDQPEHIALTSARETLAWAYFDNDQSSKAVETIRQMVSARENLPENHVNLLKPQEEPEQANARKKQVAKAIEMLEHMLELEGRHTDFAGRLPLHEVAARHMDVAGHLSLQFELARQYLADTRAPKAVELLHPIVEEQRRTLPVTNTSRMESEDLLRTAYSAREQITTGRLSESHFDDSGLGTSVPTASRGAREHHPSSVSVIHEETLERVQEDTDDLDSNVSASTEALPPHWIQHEFKLAHKFARILALSVEESLNPGELSQGSSKEIQQSLHFYSRMLRGPAVQHGQKAARRFVKSRRKLISHYVSQPTEYTQEQRDEQDMDSTQMHSQLQTMDNDNLGPSEVHKWLETVESGEHQSSSVQFVSHQIAEQRRPEQDVISVVGSGSESESNYGDLESDVADMEKFLVGNSCWGWLKDRVEVHTRTRSWPLVCVKPITRAFRAMPASQRLPGHFCAEFVVSWHPRTFLRLQFDDSNNWRLGDVIVLSGRNGEFQACTCSEYLRMMWPTMGHELLRVLEDDLQNGHAKDVKHILPYDSEVSVVLNAERPDHLIIQAYAPIPGLVDIAEQLAWLGEALSASDQPGTACYSQASCNLTFLGTSGDEYTSFCIAYEAEEFDVLDQGSCWKRLFSNPSIAYDFPARSRDHDQTGMEMTLDVMITLGEIDTATTFDNRFILKGFSSAYYLTKCLQSTSSMIWHFCCRSDGSYLPSLEGLSEDMGACTPLDKFWLQSTRHFVGWTPESFYNVGMKDTDYTRIRPPRSDKGSNLVLKQLALGGSEHVTASATIARGKHHQGVFFRSVLPFIRRIHQAKAIQVVMYDTDERRAWLMDGATALLHLLCCKLAAQVSLKAQVTNYENVTQQFQYANSDGSKSSESVLCDTGNMGLILNKASNHRVEDEIKNQFEYLQRILEVQNKIEDWKMRLTDRVRLEGYSFRDLVDDAVQFNPKMVYLQDSCGDWVDLIRDTNAVVLMAKGFGELISSRQTTCPNWSTVPVGEDYLAVRIELLEAIAASNGREDEFPFWLTHNTRWHSDGDLFKECRGKCLEGRAMCCTRAQEIRPPKLPRIVLGLKPPRLDTKITDGAVVFGRNLRMPWVENAKSRVLQHFRRDASPSKASEQTTTQPTFASRPSEHEDRFSNEVGDHDKPSSSTTLHRTPSSNLTHIERYHAGLNRSESPGSSDTPPTSLTARSGSGHEFAASLIGASNLEIERRALGHLNRRSTSLQRRKGHVNLRIQGSSQASSAKEDDGTFASNSSQERQYSC